ncbi:hypothetical protein Tco_1191675 [Tanacetum coccineum]
MVYQLTKFHVQRVDMVINPPWNLPFLGAKGLTSPEQTATGKGISNPFMAVMVCQKPYGIQLTNVSSTETLKNSCCKDKKRRLEVLQIKNNLKNSIYNILRKLKVFKVKIKNVLKELEVHNTKLSLANSNSYLRDILGDILGKDMYYPLTFVKPIRVSLVYKRNPKAQCYVRVFESNEFSAGVSEVETMQKPSLFSTSDTIRKRNDSKQGSRTPTDSYLVSDVVQAIDCDAKAAILVELGVLLPYAPTGGGGYEGGDPEGVLVGQTLKSELHEVELALPVYCISDYLIHCLAHLVGNIEILQVV